MEIRTSITIQYSKKWREYTSQRWFCSRLHSLQPRSRRTRIHRLSGIHSTLGCFPPSFGFPKASHTSSNSHLALISIWLLAPINLIQQALLRCQYWDLTQHFRDRLHVFCMSGTLSTRSPRIQRSQRRTLPDLTSPRVWINLSQIVSEMRELLNDTPGWASMGGQ
jgi:hypothetical protein